MESLLNSGMGSEMYTPLPLKLKLPSSAYSTHCIGVMYHCRSSKCSIVSSPICKHTIQHWMDKNEESCGDVAFGSQKILEGLALLPTLAALTGKIPEPAKPSTIELAFSVQPSFFEYSSKIVFCKGL